MKLEIDIPSIIYNDAKENGNYISVTKLEIAWKAIADGKPLEQEPFINKPCVSEKQCEHDKNVVLDKVRAEMLEEMLSHSGTGEEVIQAYADGLKKGLDILDKYKTEGENP